MRAACLLLLGACACGGPATPPDDAGSSDAGRDGGSVDAGPVFLLPHCEDTEEVGEGQLAHVPSTLIASIAPELARLAAPGPMNPASEDGETMYRSMRFDRYAAGPAQDAVLRTDLGGTTPPATGRRSIAFFAMHSDFQLVDDESPNRLAAVDTAGVPGGLRSQEGWLRFALDSMNRTLARVHRPERPYDFGIITGDCADSAQANELRWVIELMNGAPGVELDSGDDDDPVPGPGNDPKDAFDAQGFDAPWLYVPGNHDLEVVGVNAPDDGFRAAAIGTRATTGTRDYRRWYAPVTTGRVPADPERRITGRAEIVQALLADTTTEPGPPGHGFVAGTDTTIGANYVYDAIPGLLRVIALDTSDDSGGSPGLIHRPTIDGFLRPALEQAQTDGMLVMLASHHSTTAINTASGEFGAEVADAVPAAEIEQLVASFGNVVLWIVGHNHDNRVRAVAGPDADHPGYWEVMTSALADWPGQSRVIEIVDNGDGTLSIFATLIDFDSDSCFERRYRRLLQMEWVSAWSDEVSHDPVDLNVELLRAIPSEASAAISGATAGDRIETLTTLRGD